MNWRSPLLRLAFEAKALRWGAETNVNRLLAKAADLGKAEKHQIKSRQHQLLKELILHCDAHVPYYRKILRECELIENN
ncbi:MAG TPA: hypothetical protein PKH07_05480, partial [bacterium]|nr:hypothetical protein [bacterium]